MPSTEPENWPSAERRTSSLRRRKKKSNQRRMEAKKRPIDLLVAVGSSVAVRRVARKPGDARGCRRRLEVRGDVAVDVHDLGLLLGLPVASVGRIGDLLEHGLVGVVADRDGMDLDAGGIRLGGLQLGLQLREGCAAVG